MRTVDGLRAWYQCPGTDCPVLPSVPTAAQELSTCWRAFVHPASQPQTSLPCQYSQLPFTPQAIKVHPMASPFRFIPPSIPDPTQECVETIVLYHVPRQYSVTRPAWGTPCPSIPAPSCATAVACLSQSASPSPWPVLASRSPARLHCTVHGTHKATAVAPRSNPLATVASTCADCAPLVWFSLGRYLRRRRSRHWFPLARGFLGIRCTVRDHADPPLTLPHRPHSPPQLIHDAAAALSPAHLAPSIVRHRPPPSIAPFPVTASSLTRQIHSSASLGRLPHSAASLCRLTPPPHSAASLCRLTPPRSGSCASPSAAAVRRCGWRGGTGGRGGQRRRWRRNGRAAVAVKVPAP